MILIPAVAKGNSKVTVQIQILNFAWLLPSLKEPYFENRDKNLRFQYLLNYNISFGIFQHFLTSAVPNSRELKKKI